MPTPKKNVLVAQSGGPSPVINASLQGVIEACMAFPERVGGIYAAWHGIEGVLLEELVDVRKQPLEEIRLLRHTPASGVVGTCRYKLKETQTEDFERIIDVFRAHDIGYFFYIGGNDSMDTASKVSALAAARGLELVVAGVPKTIDNDLGDEAFTIIDHTPGYGSCARYWAYLMQNADQENRAMCTSECVSVYQAMGRKAGWITAASRLADPDREMPLQLYMAESGHNLESLAENVNRELVRSGRCVVVVNEGFDVGSIGEKHDGFGHVEYGGERDHGGAGGRQLPQPCAPEGAGTGHRAGARGDPARRLHVRLGGRHRRGLRGRPESGRDRDEGRHGLDGHHLKEERRRLCGVLRQGGPRHGGQLGAVHT